MIWMSKQKDLYIPGGIKREREYFNGYGQKEFITTVISVIISSVLAFYMYNSSGSTVKPMFALLAIPSGVVMFIIRNDYNVSAFDQIKFMVEFKLSQKKYEYEYMDELDE